MYLPSLLFGGSALIHILSAYPRVVAAFGLAALITATLQTPLGRVDLPGTAGYLRQLDVHLQRTVDDATVERARGSVPALRQSSPARLAEIVDGTLNRCGAGCVGLNTADVLRDPALLDRVLFVYELDRAAPPAHTSLPPRRAVED